MSIKNLRYCDIIVPEISGLPYNKIINLFSKINELNRGFALFHTFNYKIISELNNEFLINPAL